VCPQAKKSKSERGGIEKAATDVDTKAFANSKNFFKAMQAEADRYGSSRNLSACLPLYLREMPSASTRDPLGTTHTGAFKIGPGHMVARGQ
jgi:hypothetical protein